MDNNHNNFSIVFFACIQNNCINVFNSANNTTTVYSNADFNTLINNNIVVVCNKNYFTSHSNLLDVLELILMVYGNINVNASIPSIANYFNLATIPNNSQLLYSIVQCVLHYATCMDIHNASVVYSLCSYLQKHNWLWASIILNCINKSNVYIKDYYNVWKYIDKYKEDTEDHNNFKHNAEDVIPVNTAHVLEVLKEITLKFNSSRVEQQNYTKFIANCFANYTVDNTHITNFAIANAGTGVGKTLGYLANAIAFVNKNPNKQVVISTYSKNLQKQIYQNLQEIFKHNPKQIALAKGSNNYVCLLNYNYLLNSFNPSHVVMLTLLARVLIETQSGDLVGGELNSIVFAVVSPEILNNILNKKEECIYSKCSHFNNCLVMKAKHNIKQANIVVSNHHFTLLNNMLGAKVVIWDEAHHLFDVADNLFCTSFDAISLIKLRYWVCGGGNPLAKAKSALNGLVFRVKNILNNNDDDLQEINDLINANVEVLAKMFFNFIDYNSLNNVINNNPQNVVEQFLFYVQNFTVASAADYNQYYNIETNAINADFLTEDFLNIAGKLLENLIKIQKISTNILTLLNQCLAIKENKALEEFIKVFNNNIIVNIDAYVLIMHQLTKPDTATYTYRFVVFKNEHKITNIAYIKNYIDPTQPLSTNVFSSLNVCVFTSATMANIHTTIDVFGIKHLNQGVYNLTCIDIPSPFNYQANSKIIIVNNTAKGNIASLTNAMHNLFNSSNGGALAVFTSIMRLKQTYANLSKISSFNIMAQHVNNNKLVNLIQEFKTDSHSCLLGTDATRDGVDVPGNALRMVVLERFPWGRPEILATQRKKHFGKAFAEYNVKIKLKQAFGRLIRTNTDKGVFVLLDNAVPSQYLSVFPEDCQVLKISLQDATVEIKKFFNN